MIQRLQTPRSGTAFTGDDFPDFGARESSEAFGREYTLCTLRGRPAPWLGKCLAELNSLKNLRPNWDSYGALPADRNSIEIAKQVLKTIALIDEVEEPVVTASPSGNAAFCWDNGTRSLDLEVCPDGELQYSYSNAKAPYLDSDGSTKDWRSLGFELVQF